VKKRRPNTYRGVLLKDGKIIVRTEPHSTRKAASAAMRRILSITPGADDAVIVVGRGEVA
jgi:hypothetical protein